MSARKHQESRTETEASPAGPPYPSARAHPSCAALVLLLALGGLNPLLAQNRPHAAQPDRSRAEQVWQERPQSAVHYQPAEARQPIQQVTRTVDPRRPLDVRISSMPRSDQRLEVIHRRSQLVVTRDRIRRMAWSDPSVLDVVQFSETEISILGQDIGTTDLWLWFEGQPEPLMYVVTVIRDPSLEEQRRIDYGRIERRLALLYPNSKVYLIPMSRKIIVRGQARDASEAARIMQIVRGEVVAQEGDLYGLGDLGRAGGGVGGLDPTDRGRFNDFLSSIIVDELQVPGEFHVMTRVRIAELNRSQLRRLGVDFEVLFAGGRHAIAQTLTGSPGVLAGIFENGEISVAIDALASNGSARVLEDAQLVTLSGEPAAFLSGGEFAVPTIVGIGGAAGQMTTFRGFGTSIIATPTVVDRDLIRLQIVPEMSAINAGNAVQGIPGVDVRRVQTRVELREGQTIVLGGLFARREQAEVTRIPFLGEIPFLGNYLFNTKQATEDENEMLIIVTPEIVRPMDADQVPPLPGWYVTHPDDFDLYKFNRIEGNPDLGHYQLLPYGNGQGFGHDVGYNFYNPPPADGQIAPLATGGPLQGPGPGQLLAPPGGPFAPPYQPPHSMPYSPHPAQQFPPQHQHQQQPYQQYQQYEHHPPQYQHSPGFHPPQVPPAEMRPGGLQPTPAVPRTGQDPSSSGVQQTSGTSNEPRRTGFFRRR